MVERASSREPDGFANVYALELLYERQPAIRPGDLLAALRSRCGRVVQLSRDDSLLWPFAFEDHRATFTDGSGPVQALIDVTRGMPDDLESALQQSWDWRSARNVVARCGAAVMVADFMAQTLPCRDRIALLRRIVLAVMEAAPPAAIHWRESGRIVDPDDFRRAMAPESTDHLFPAVNVRLFNIANGGTGEMAMDTLGLAALGVPDAQCHFAGLDATRMAGLLYDSAHYLFEHGDVIADGHTIQGFTPEQRWVCRHEDAMVGPARVVLDLDPGPPHAAGQRGTA